MFDFDDEDKDNPIGSVLRYYRLQRKLDLDHISEELRIRLDYLEAMERGRFDLLPAGIYRRSFLKAYAEYLKLDADNVVRMLDQRQGTPDREMMQSRPAPKAPLGEPAETENSVKEGLAPKMPPPVKPPSRENRAAYGFLVFLGLVIGALCVIFLFKIGIEDGQRMSATAALAEAESLMVVPEPPDTMELFMQLLDEKIGQAPELVLRVEASGRSWIQVFSDGVQLYTGFVDENMSAEFKFRDKLSINMGVNQGVRGFLNGFELIPLESGITRLDRENFIESIPMDKANELVRVHESTHEGISP